ncbi:hypothetical protein L1987_88180 [Smallanthus sonchifolius]|nr:hypothetical protein L1987_89078 [Smallanthus sonchifolius]KAI3668800.1 hypothetical protein L1987_88180 [Smallanthus sonchifolius]
MELDARSDSKGEEAIIGSPRLPYLMGNAPFLDRTGLLLSQISIRAREHVVGRGTECVLSLSYSDIENRRKAESLSLLMLEALKTIPVWVKFSKQTPCPQVLEVFTDDKNFVEVEVEYQNKPQSCSICKIFGHNMYKCPKSNFYNGCPEEKTPGAEPSSMPSMEHKSVENEE